MACGDSNPGVLVGHGIGGTIKRALARAFRDLQGQGDLGCAGGACAGGNCEWICESVQFAGDFNTETLKWEGTATGTGSCKCV